MKYLSAFCWLCCELIIDSIRNETPNVFIDSNSLETANSCFRNRILLEIGISAMAASASPTFDAFLFLFSLSNCVVSLCLCLLLVLVLQLTSLC